LSDARARLAAVRAGLLRFVVPVRREAAVLRREAAVLRREAAVLRREGELREVLLRFVVPVRRAAVLRLFELVRRDGELRDVLLRLVVPVRRDAVLLRVVPRAAVLRVVLRVALERLLPERVADVRLPPERVADARRVVVPVRDDEGERVEAAERRGLPRDDFADDLRFGFSGMPTPARRASESPIAMACRAFFAPCLPLRIWSISRCTNSPACVLADLPARLSRWARRIVSLSGMLPPERMERTLAVQ
jgi:hypothetical protein